MGQTIGAPKGVVLASLSRSPFSTLKSSPPLRGGVSNLFKVFPSQTPATDSSALHRAPPSSRRAWRKAFFQPWELSTNNPFGSSEVEPPKVLETLFNPSTRRITLPPSEGRRRNSPTSMGSKMRASPPMGDSSPKIDPTRVLSTLTAPPFRVSKYSSSSPIRFLSVVFTTASLFPSPKRLSPLSVRFAEPTKANLRSTMTNFAWRVG